MFSSRITSEPLSRPVTLLYTLDSLTPNLSLLTTPAVSPQVRLRPVWPLQQIRGTMRRCVPSRGLPGDRATSARPPQGRLCSEASTTLSRCRQGRSGALEEGRVPDGDEQPLLTRERGGDGNGLMAPWREMAEGGRRSPVLGLTGSARAERAGTLPGEHCTRASRCARFGSSTPGGQPTQLPAGPTRVCATDRRAEGAICSVR